MRMDLGRFDKRKIMRVVAVVAVALAAGHLVQTMASRQSPPQTAKVQAGSEPAGSKPVAVVQLAATTTPVAEPTPAKTPLPAAALATAPQPAPKMTTEKAAGQTPDKTVTPSSIAPVAADACPITLDLMADPGAMIGLTLLAPCNPGERVVLKHAGLVIAVTTTATGSIFLALPALETDALVEVRFDDGHVTSGTLQVPDLATLRRFGVQWQGDDAFQVFGYERDRVISANAPGLAPLAELPLDAGYLTRLGDAAARSPLLAEIYTYPTTGASDVVVEAAITPTTCGREILGETLASMAGAVTVTDLTLAMPECDAVGDFLVLNNLAPDVTLAAAN